jgi:hypothetical protein
VDRRQEALELVEPRLALDREQRRTVLRPRVMPALDIVATPCVTSTVATTRKPAARRSASLTPGGVKTKNPIELRAAISAFERHPVTTTGSV